MLGNIISERTVCYEKGMRFKQVFEYEYQIKRAFIIHYDNKQGVKNGQNRNLESMFEGQAGESRYIRNIRLIYITLSHYSITQLANAKMYV